MKRIVLWVDDEIDLLKPHIIFLEKKDIFITGINNGDDGIEFLRNNKVDLVLLDEMMPGKDGLTVAEEMKNIKPYVPIIMVTKNEEENLMEQAISSNINDYLLKPINPMQVLIAIRKMLDKNKIKSDQIGQNYVSKYRQLQNKFFNIEGIDDWYYLYNQLILWEDELDDYSDDSLKEMHRNFFDDAEHEFSRYIKKQYPKWLKDIDNPKRPVMSPDILAKYLFPLLKKKNPVLLVVLDCMYLGQWYEMEKFLKEYFYLETYFYLSILPTATPYSRNSIFSGLFPIDLYKLYPKYWHANENSYNQFEAEMLWKYMAQYNMENLNTKFYKIFVPSEMEKVNKDIEKIKKTDFTVLIYNFLDIIVHKRDKNEILTEIVDDYKGMRSLTRAWFENSYLFRLLKELGKYMTIVITTDHGSIIGKKSCLVRGNRETSTSVRYKYGTNLFGEKKKSLLVKNPTEFLLPLETPSMNYLFATEDYYFVYPNNYNEYEKLCKGSFLHGGISMHEMILPVVTLSSRG